VPAGYGLNLLSSERHHFARAFFRRRRLLGIDMDLHGNWSAICDGQTTWENYGWGWHPGAARHCACVPMAYRNGDILPANNRLKHASPTDFILALARR
jgi:hypothetical protein